MYYCKIFKMMHLEILNEEFFGEFYANTVSDCLSNIYTSVSEDDGAGLVTKSCLTLVAPWTVACQAPLSMGLPRQEHWSGLPFPSPGDPPDPRG